MSTPAPQPGDVIAGKYRIESVLGRGGMGVVYAARHTLSERRVAVKWMEADLQNGPDALDRFVREARAMGRIEHPNVVGVLDVGTEGSIAYLVMDILRGESLRELMTREHNVSPALALATIFPVLEGVEAAHRAGVVHRDLKPENLFVVRGPDGEAQTTKVLDFGISKLTENDSKKQDAKRLTKTGHVVGTPAYMSPEQVRGGAVDARTDVWALSTILYEMLANRTPFEAANYGALLVAIATEPYTPLDPQLVAPDLARVIHRGLAKEPDDRWPSVIALARALEPFARDAKFVEPHRPSLVPLDPVRGSTAPTVPGGPPVPRAAAVDTPELDMPAPRAAAPTPIRLARPEAPVSELELPASSPRRRTMTLVAIAVALVVGFVVVLRGIGNAARDAAFAPPTSVALPSPPITHAPTPSVAPTTVAPPPEPPPASTVVGLDPPPATHARHATHAPTGTSAPPSTEAAPPTTTSTSRSGSISRDDF